jgi:exonuclease III
MNFLKKWIVLCWNIRGLNANTRQLSLMNAIRISGCVLICLQETKKDKFDLKFIKSCCTPCFDEFVYVPSAGASGGLIIIWKSSIFSGIVMHSEAYALYVYFTSTQSSQS